MTEQEEIKIHEYLEGILSPEETQEVAKRIEEDPAWKAAHQEARLVRDMAEVHGASQLRQRLQAIHQEVVQSDADEGAKVIPLHRRWQAIAASILLPVAAALAWFMLQSSPSLDDTLAEVYQPETWSTVRGSEDSEGVLEEARTAYEKQRYEEAAVALEALGSTEPDIQIKLAISYIQTKKWAKAEQILSPLTTTSARDRATWYLAISYLLQENTAAAKPLLQSLISDPNLGAGASMKSDAEQLLEAIE